MRNSFTPSAHTVWLYAFSFLGALFIFSIFYFSKPANDDLALMALQREMGFLKVLEFNYNYFNFRHITTLVFLLITKADYAQFLKIITCVITVLIFIYAFKHLFKGKIINLISNESKVVFLPTAILFLMAVYHISFASVELFSSFIIFLYYVFPIALGLLGIALLVNYSNAFKLQISIAVLFFIAGSGSEIISGFLLFCLLLYYNAENKVSKKKIIKPLVLLALIPLLISASVVYLAPGTAVRWQIEETTTPYHPLHNFILSLWHLLFQKKSLWTLYWFIFFFLFAVLFENKLKIAACINKILLNKHLLLLAILTFIMIGTISNLVFKGFAPARVWFPLNFILSIYVFLSSYALGSLLRSYKLLILPQIIACFLLLIYTAYAILKVRDMYIFSTAYEARIEKIKELQAVEKTISLKPLPDSGILAFPEINENPSAEINQNLLKAYGFEGKIVLDNTP